VVVDATTDIPFRNPIKMAKACDQPTPYGAAWVLSCTVINGNQI